MSLTFLVHGEAGSGKSPVLATAPGRTLFIAAESGHRFLRQRPRVEWNPRTALPKDIPENAMVIATLRATSATEASPEPWEDALRALDVLLAGKHPFDSVCVDTLTSLQAHCIAYATSKSRRGELDQQVWGVVLRQMRGYVSLLTEQTAHPTHPLEVVAMSAQSVQKEGEDMWTPDLSGAVRTALIEMFDVFGFMQLSGSFDPSTGVPSPGDRRLAVSPGYGVQARDRTSALPNGGISGMLGPVISGPINLADLNTLISE